MIQKSICCLILWCLALANPAISAAQNPSCQGVTGKEAVTIERDCYRYDFPFFLKYSGTDVPAPTEFQTCTLIIEGHLSGPNVIINEALSQAQVHGNLAGGNLTFNGNNFTYEYDAAANNQITVPLGNGNNLLTITAEGRPGDDIEMTITNVSFIIDCAGASCNLQSNNGLNELLDFNSPPFQSPRPVPMAIGRSAWAPKLLMATSFASPSWSTAVVHSF